MWFSIVHMNYLSSYRLPSRQKCKRFVAGAYLRMYGQEYSIASSSVVVFFFFSSRRRHTRFDCDWSSDVCSSDLGDHKVAVVGASFAASRGLTVGSHIRLEDEEYEVVGVLDRMLTAPDRFVMVSIADARAQWVAKDRLLRTVLASGGMALTASDLNTGAAVGWRDGDDPDAVALRIKERVPGVNVQLPSELSRLLRSSTAFFSALLAGIGALAFVIGGLSLANTMAAAVFERIRDFGIKRALGATDLQLGREVLAESLAVTMVGGLGGIGLARALGWFIDRYLAQAQQLFHFSPRPLGGGPAFSILLGAAAAIYATGRVVSLSPAEAIRRGA